MMKMEPESNLQDRFTRGFYFSWILVFILSAPIAFILSVIIIINLFPKPIEPHVSMYFLLTLIEGLITGVLTIMLMRFYLAIRVGSLWLLSYLSVFSLVSLSATILLKTNFLELFISEGGWAGLLAPPQHT